MGFSHSSVGKESACNAGTEKAMAPHSSTLAWKIPWTEQPGRLQSMGSLRATSLSRFTSMHWRRKWQPTPVFLPGESQGRQSLVGCCLWDCTESDTTEVTQQQQQQCRKPRFRFLGWEDPLEKEMATHSSILAWRIPWAEEPERLQSTGSQESDATQQLNHHRQRSYYSFNLFIVTNLSLAL